MALIKCTECQKEISDKAPACPHCGCPVVKNTLSDETMLNVLDKEDLSKEKIEQNTILKKKNKIIFFILIPVILLALLGGIVMISGDTGIEKEIKMVENFFSLNYEEILKKYPDAELEYPDNDDDYDLCLSGDFAGISGQYDICVSDDGSVWRVIFDPGDSEINAANVIATITEALGEYVEHDSEWEYYTWKTNNLEIKFYAEDRTFFDWIGEEIEVNELQKSAECSKNGHVKGEWEITKEPTFTEDGVEELFCAVCNETLDSQSIDKKIPLIEYERFNFTDDELIDWLNDIAKFETGYTDVGDYDNGNTLYRVTYDGETGGLLLNHGDSDESGYVCAIMVYFDDWSTAVAVAAWIGEQIDSDFSADDSFVKIANDESYTAADMTLVDIDGIVTLAPSEYFADILEN